MARPLNDWLDIPKPKMVSNRLRGVVTSALQTVVRPDRLVSSVELSPLASQVVTTPDSVIAPNDNARLAAANSFRTRALTVNRLNPATKMPATIATRAVLVCVSSSIGVPITTAIRHSRPDARPHSQSRTIRPVVTAAKCATWVGGYGQSAPSSLPPAYAVLGATTRPSSTVPSTIDIATR